MLKRKTVCKCPTCPEPCIDGSAYCAEHQAQARASYETRQQASERNAAYNNRRPEDNKYYGTAHWKSLRAEKLALTPHCELNYISCGKKGQIVHHIIPRNKGGADSLANLQTVCRNCHNTLHKSHSVPPVTTKDNSLVSKNTLPEIKRKTIDYRGLGKLLG